jgi:hypothetical protein
MNWLATIVRHLIIEIDGYFHQVKMTGSKCTIFELRQKYKSTKKVCNSIHELPELFCLVHNFQPILTNEDLEVDFVIDTDTDRIYSPSY